MWWGKSPDKPAEPPKEPSPASTVAGKAEKAVEQTAKQFDPDKLPDRQKLPPSLQKIIDKADKEDNFYDELVAG